MISTVAEAGRRVNDWYRFVAVVKDFLLDK
jgi:hypothetical protein